MTHTRYKFLLLAGCTVFITVSIIGFILLNQHFSAHYLHIDEQWGLFCADQLLQGKQYYDDFFETNPPLIILFFTPFVFIGHSLSIAPTMVLDSFFYTAIIAVFYLNIQLLRPIFNHDIMCVYWIASIIFISELFLAIEAFTEREHLTLLVFIPYILLLTRRCKSEAQQKIPISPYLAGAIGLFVAFGIALKPYFLIPVLLVEIYHCIKIKKVAAFFRIETTIMLIFWIIYVIGVYLYFPQFYTKVLPLDNHLYTTFGKMPISLLLGNDVHQISVIIALLLMSFLLYYMKKSTQRDFICLLLLSTFGFFIVYLLAGQRWYYHLYPAFALSFIMVFSAVCVLRQTSLYAKYYTAHNFWQVLLVFLSCILLAAQLFYTITRTHMLASSSIIDDIQVPIHLCQQDQQAHSNNNILVLSQFLQTYYIIALCDGATSSMRFPHLALIPGLIYLQKIHDTKAYQYYKNVFFTLLNHDIQKKPPHLIIIDRRGYQVFFNKKLINGQLLPFLISDPIFQQFFKHYYLIEKTTNFMIYALK